MGCCEGIPFVVTLLRDKGLAALDTERHIKLIAEAQQQGLITMLTRSSRLNTSTGYLW